MKRIAALAILLALTGCHKNQSTACVPLSDEMCPTPEFLAEWNELGALEKKYAPPKPTKDDELRYIGLKDDIDAQIGKMPPPAPGFYWKWQPGRLVFKKDAIPAPATPNAQPVQK